MVCFDEGVMLETSAKHHIPTFVDQTHVQRTRPCRKTVFFKTSLPNLHVLCFKIILTVLGTCLVIIVTKVQVRIIRKPIK